MNTNSPVLCEKKGRLAILKVNRPTVLNALNREVVERIDEELDQITKDKTIGVLIVTGDIHFASGADIADMVGLNSDQAEEFMFAKTFEKLEAMEIPTIAAICGYALGGGLELALSCDFRIASEQARMGLPEIGLGIIPGAGGTIRLPRLIGEVKAKELILLGGNLKALEALACGLVSKVVPEEMLMVEAEALAEKLLEKAPLAIAAAKKSIALGVYRSGAFAGEAKLWTGLFDTADQKEGMTAFLEKRKPVYMGR